MGAMFGGGPKLPDGMGDLADLDPKQLEAAAKQMGQGLPSGGLPTGGLPGGLPGLGGQLPPGLSGFGKKK